MKRSIIWFLLIAFLVIGMVSGGALAQTPGDPDGDGVFGAKDFCPNDPGPASNNGCPLPLPQVTAEVPVHPPGDSDGDGTPDEKDQCPLDGGPDWNNGCPTNQNVPPSQPQIVLPAMPTSGECVVATAGQGRVNVREMPSTTAAIIGVLNPADLYPAFATFTDESGGIWYLVSMGWVSGGVVRTGGACDQLPDFSFNDVLLKVTDGPGGGLILTFAPMTGGKPFITLRPFAGKPVSLNFSKGTNDLPEGGFAFYLAPFPGSPNNKPESTPQAPASDLFADDFLRSHMGDGSVFMVMPPLSRGDNNPLNGILIGLSQPDVDPNGILIGLSQPTIDPDGILIGLSQPGSLNGILIGLLLPAVQTGNNTYGILIGLLLPAVQKINGDASADRYGFAPEAGGTGGTFTPHIQKIRDSGLNFLTPSADALTRHFLTTGWHLETQGIVMPSE